MSRDDIEDGERPTPTAGDVADTMGVRKATQELRRTRTRVAGVVFIAALVVVGVWVWSGRSIVISDEIKVLTASTLGIGAVSAPYMIAFVNRLWSPNQVFVIRVNITQQIPVRIYTASPSQWDDVTTVSGEPFGFMVGGKACYLVTNFTHTDDVRADDEVAQHIPDDVTGWIATHSWLGEASDAEIVRARNQIEGNRRRNHIWARYGEVIDSKVDEIVLNTERRHHKKLTNHELDETVFGGGEHIREEINRSLPTVEDAESDSMHSIIEDEVSRQIEAENRPDEVTNRE